MGADFGGAEEGFASFGLEPLASVGVGRSYGAELVVQKKLSESKWYGTASVAYGHSRFTALDGIERPGRFDQRVIANLSGGYQLGDNWEFGVRFRLATGRPYSPIDSTGDPTFGYQIVDEYHTQRLDLSHALDIRIDRHWPISGINLITYIDIQNIYNRKNPEPPRWNPRLGAGEVQASAIGILPTIGVSVEF
ncbi:MAG: TonB-dependent receptor [bacterium]|nr:TonB-dependent receptor [Candidatus Kapabacteria bacterium]